MKLAALTLLGILLGFGLVLLLPLVYAIWLQNWLADVWAYWTGTPHVCDAGNPSPTELEQAFNEVYGECPHGIKPADRCLICAIQESGEEPDTEQALDDLIRSIRDTQAEAEKKPLEDSPLPAVSADWLQEYKERKGKK